MTVALRRALSLLWVLGWSVLVIAAAATEAHASIVWSESFDQVTPFLEGTQLSYAGQGWTADLTPPNHSIFCVLGLAMGTATMSSPFTLVGATPAASLSFSYGWSPGGGAASVEASADGGATWSGLQSLSNVPVPPGTSITVSLAGFAGQPRVLVRFPVFGGAGLTRLTLDDLVVDNGQTAVLLTSFSNAVLAGGSSQAVTWTYAGPLAGAASIAIDYFDATGVLQQVARGLPVNSGTYNWTVPLVNVEKVRLRVAVLDGGGAVLAADSSDRAFSIDSIAPDPVALTAPANGGCVSPTGRVQWAGLPFDATATVNIQSATGVPIVVSGLYAADYQLPNLPESGNPYVWKVILSDAAGNSSSSPSWSFRVDGTPPSAPGLTSPAAGAFVTSPTPVTWAASADTGCGTLASYDLLVDGASCTRLVGTQTSAALGACRASQGAHTWSVRATDGVGNTATSAERSVQIDDLGPGRISDRVFVSGYAVSGSPGRANLAVVQGENVYLRATGQWCPGVCMIGPEGRIGCAGFNSYNTACGQGSLMSTLATTAHPCTGPLYTGTAEQDLSRVDLYSNGGDLSTVACSDTLTVDLVIGTPKLLTPGAFSGSARPTFSWSAVSDAGSGGVHYQVVLDGQPLGASTTATSLAAPADLPVGHHSWLVRARDALENAADSPTASLDIQTAGPAPFSAQTTCSGLPTPSLCWTATSGASPISRFQIWIDGALNLDGIASTTSCSTPGSGLSLGAHDWYVVAVDVAGNRTQSQSAKVVIDTAPPSAPPVARTPVAGATVYTDRPHFTWDPATDAGGIARYEVIVDGTVVGSVDAPATELTAANPLAVGSRSWRVRAYDYCNNTIDSSPLQVMVFACPPTDSGACPSDAGRDSVSDATAFDAGAPGPGDGAAVEHAFADAAAERPPNEAGVDAAAGSDTGSGVDASVGGDAGASADGGSKLSRASGCSCRLDAPHPWSGAAGAALVALALAQLRARRRRR